MKMNLQLMGGRGSGSGLTGGGAGGESAQITPSAPLSPMEEYTQKLKDGTLNITDKQADSIDRITRQATQKIMSRDPDKEIKQIDVSDRYNDGARAFVSVSITAGNKNEDSYDRIYKRDHAQVFIGKNGGMSFTPKGSDKAVPFVSFSDTAYRQKYTASEIREMKKKYGY